MMLACPVLSTTPHIMASYEQRSKFAARRLSRLRPTGLGAGTQHKRAEGQTQ